MVVGSRRTGGALALPPLPLTLKVLVENITGFISQEATVAGKWLALTRAARAFSIA
jgi:hypothetical protein